MVLLIEQPSIRKAEGIRHAFPAVRLPDRY
jgi:hypothetical protein